MNKKRSKPVDAVRAEDLKLLEADPLVGLLACDEGADIEFEPGRLGLTARGCEFAAGG